MFGLILHFKIKFVQSFALNSKALKPNRKMSDICPNLKENIPKNDQKKFVADLQYDLNTLASYNIARMGITQKELKEWKTWIKY
jgi:hypothetical protein